MQLCGKGERREIRLDYAEDLEDRESTGEMVGFLLGGKCWCDPRP